MTIDAISMHSSHAGEPTELDGGDWALAPSSVEDEIANSLTHGAGLVLSLVGLGVLAVQTSMWGDFWQVVGCSVFGIALVTLYAASTLYHVVQNPRMKRILRLIDHMSIYLLIAGTYTPFTLVSLKGTSGWMLFALVWSLAAAGMIFKLVFGDRRPMVSLGFYIALGWIAVLFGRQVLTTLPTPAILLLLVGGFAYTAGTVFYALDHRRFFHAIWHLFVLAGSGLHFCAVALYVAPTAI